MPTSTRAPSLRLACAPGGSGKKRYPAALSPSVRLAHVGPVNALRHGLKPHPSPHQQPALLVSYFYLAAFKKAMDGYGFRDWVLDSGAYSAKNSGVVIDLDRFTADAKALLATDPKLTEVFALDVIGDWRATKRNVERMWKAGVPAIPTFHSGEPWDVLVGLARDYPKIAVGGLVGASGRSAHSKEKSRWLDQVFARVWPKRIHGFGLGSASMIMRYPLHSTDATNWEIAACKYGRWRAYGNAHLPIRGGNQPLRAEVEYYLALERRAQQRWEAEMKLLETAA